MKFKEDAEPVYTTDLYYDFFEGGGIDETKLLEADDAAAIIEARVAVEMFLDRAKMRGLIEVG